ncbi:MAG: hypothetical protein BIFFINMI_02622 [Phycisphaerae bacterium]|nr:hypothetical protein [Phycisphaerae bacterium]
MKIDCICPNCYRPMPVRSDRRGGWVSCVKCGHVFRFVDAVQATRYGAGRTGRTIKLLGQS